MNDFLFSILSWINSWVGSWGWSMVVFTIMIRLVLTPLDVKSRVSMRKTTKLQPMQAALQKKYANDKEKLNQKMAELYKKEHINPLSSCLPLLLTWPILIAVFGAMRMAANEQLLNQLGQILQGNEPVLEPFLWNIFSTAYPDVNTLRIIPTDQWLNWFHKLSESGLPALLQDLNLTDASFEGNALTATVQSIVDVMKAQVPFYAKAVANTPYSVPLLGTVPVMFNGFLLLPILSAVSQIVMTKIMSGSQPQQPAANGQPNTGKFMQWFFPIFSLWICLGYSAAFALYWVAGNLVSMGQTLIINKILDNREKEAALAGEGTVK